MAQYHLTMQHLSMQHFSMQHLSVQHLSMQHLSVQNFSIQHLSRDKICLFKSATTPVWTKQSNFKLPTKPNQNLANSSCGWAWHSSAAAWFFFHPYFLLRTTLYWKLALSVRSSDTDGILSKLQTIHNVPQIQILVFHQKSDFASSSSNMDKLQDV